MCLLCVILFQKVPQRKVENTFKIVCLLSLLMSGENTGLYIWIQYFMVENETCNLLTIICHI